MQANPKDMCANVFLDNIHRIYYYNTLYAFTLRKIRFEADHVSHVKLMLDTRVILTVVIVSLKI